MESEPKSKKKGMPRKRKRLLMAVAVIALAMVIIFWGWDTTGKSFLEVTSVTSDAIAIGAGTSHYVGKYLEVQGNVNNWFGTGNFTLTDRTNLNDTIHVTMNGTLPSGFENGKSVVVKGIISAGLPVTFHANEVTVGCASKY
ncbi:MAG TPA: cytochrome c maturation protein CcmE [Methanomassiliicoccales archaeon]|jgi:cytochrome c-type biogenesis protein CcmE